MSTGKFFRTESDCIVGKRSRLERFLICSTQGYFPVLARTGRQSLAVIFRTGGTHMSASATLAVSISKDGGKCWSDPVEITPRWESVRAGWRIEALERLAQRHARVRVTGWLMWDEEHPEAVGQSRATQWEVHPVTNFEVYDGGAWQPL